MCQVLTDRGETWYFLRQDIARSMIYFMKEEVETTIEKTKENEAKAPML